MEEPNYEHKYNALKTQVKSFLTTKDYFKAIEENNIELVKIYIDNNYINILDHNGWSGLMEAMRNGCSIIAGYLIRSGADINFKAEDKLSALSIAIENGDKSDVHLLINNGVKIDIDNVVII